MTLGILFTVWWLLLTDSQEATSRFPAVLITIAQHSRPNSNIFSKDKIHHKVSVDDMLKSLQALLSSVPTAKHGATHTKLWLWRHSLHFDLEVVFLVWTDRSSALVLLFSQSYCTSKHKNAKCVTNKCYNKLLRNFAGRGVIISFSNKLAIS